MRKSIEDIKHMVVPDKHYQGLPEKYREYEVYLKDSGYNILCIPKMFEDEAFSKDPYMYEAPIATKYVLRNIEKLEERDGHLVIEVEYSNVLGIVVNSDDYQF